MMVRLTDPGDDAYRAAAEAGDALTRQHGLWADVIRRVGRMTKLAEENHFAERIVHALRGEDEGE